MSSVDPSVVARRTRTVVAFCSRLHPGNSFVGRRFQLSLTYLIPWTEPPCTPPPPARQICLFRCVYDSLHVSIPTFPHAQLATHDIFSATHDIFSPPCYSLRLQHVSRSRSLASSRSSCRCCIEVVFCYVFYIQVVVMCVCRDVLCLHFAHPCKCCVSRVSRFSWYLCVVVSFVHYVCVYVVILFVCMSVD